ncbi:hypothetical protein HELRODRAFT_164631 [Helobdella robusta]|uniref:Uncharacterized protein n=1 Tax=Helobdella robusta TaxID=6412 RepID=T1EVN4_HELRO|nr:hypothetical protein HELRODRAFT_164631 [Helobdella robusta]ESN92558.1 hypothetical protein HELRODRAFT_164631 [Helobdella robusta]
MDSYRNVPAIPVCKTEYSRNRQLKTKPTNGKQFCNSFIAYLRELLRSENHLNFFIYNQQSKGPKTNKVKFVISADPYQRLDYVDPIKLKPKNRNSNKKNENETNASDDILPPTDSVNSYLNITDLDLADLEFPLDLYENKIRDEDILDLLDIDIPIFDNNTKTSFASNFNEICTDDNLYGDINNFNCNVSEDFYRINYADIRSTARKQLLSSRACRLRRLANHEANKIKLVGLRSEHAYMVAGNTDLYVQNELKLAAKKILEKNENL